MKIRIIFYLITFVFFTTLNSCSNQKNNPPEEVTNLKEVPPKKERDWKKYLTVKQLLEYRNQRGYISMVEKAAEPFSSIIYNKVIAYDYEGNGEAFISITTKTGTYVPVVLKQQILNQDQVEKVVSFLTSKTTYGEGTAACFNPHLAFVFYNADKIVFKTDICLDCNYQIPSQNIPAINHKKIELEDGEFYYAEGFTKSGQKKIKDLCKELNFFYGN